MNDGVRWKIIKEQDERFYSWRNKNKKLYKINVKFADKLFLEFSKHGLNRSSTDVQFANNLSPRDWNTTKNALNLYKDSDIFSPYTRESYTLDEYRTLAKQKIEELEGLQKGIIVEEYQKRKLKQANKWQAEANRKLYSIAMFNEHLLEYVKDREHEKIKLTVTKNVVAGKTILAIADLHIGQKIVKKLALANYNSAIIREMLEEALEDVRNDLTDEVELWLLGDLIESITGTMHPGMWKQMEEGMYGIKLYKTAHAILSEFIGAIPNLTKVRALGGNHDRITDNKQEDTESTVAAILFYQIQQELKPAGIEVIFDHQMQVFDMDGIRYILLHGDAGIRNKPQAIISQYGNQGMFNMIIMGDRHARNVQLDQHNARMITLAPFTIGNDYSLDLGFSSLPGYTKITHKTFKNGMTLPVIVDCPLPRM